MPFTVTKTAGFGLATAALPVFCSILLMDVRGLDPFAASASGAINSVLGREFLKFSIPGLLKVYIKQLINVFEGYMLRSAALGRHMLRICN